MPDLITIDDLRVSFVLDEGVVRAVDGVSFAIRQGEVLGLVGESGCGKSVTAMSMLRLIPQPPGRIDGGKVMFGGRNLLELPLDELRKIRGNDISVIFQEPMTALSPLHRIGRQLVETLRIHQPDLSKKEAWQQSADWLRKVGISDVTDRLYAYPFQFSGGMRQRVMIAMSMMLRPKLIIADEPTTALDVTIQAQIFELMLEMKADDMSLLLITHDMGVIWEMCDRVIVMYASQIVEQGRVKEIFESPRHPYAEGLLAAVPRLTGSAGKRLSTIPGQVPSAMNYPPNACRFCDRCPYVFDRCRKEAPPLYHLPDGRRARCFLREKDAITPPE